jgi:hypothetical protein
MSRAETTDSATWGGSEAILKFLRETHDADLRSVLEKTLVQLTALEETVFAAAGGRR